MDYLNKEFSYLLGLVVSKGRIVQESKSIYIDFKHKFEYIQGIKVCPYDNFLITESRKTKKFTCKNQNCKRIFDVDELKMKKWNQIESTKKSLLEIISPLIESLNGLKTSLIGNSQVSILKVDFTNNENMFSYILELLNYKKTFKNTRIPKLIITEGNEEIKIEFVNALLDTIGYFNSGNHFQNGRMRGYMQIVDNVKLTNDIDNLLYSAFSLPIQTIRWSHPNIVDSNLKYYFGPSREAWAKENQIKFYPELYKIFTPKIIHKNQMMEEQIQFNENNYSHYKSNSYEKRNLSLKNLNKIAANHPEENSLKLDPELRGRHIDRNWQISVLLGAYRIYDLYELNDDNKEIFFETGEVILNNNYAIFLKEKKSISENKFKELEEKNKNKLKTKLNNNNSRLLEVETYYPLQVWLKDYIKENYNSDSLVFDSSTTNLNNINFDGLNEIIEEFDDFDIKPDVVGITYNSKNLYLIESKVTKLSLEDLSQTIGYSKVIQPIEAFLVSTEEISSSLLFLLDAYPEILNYNDTQKVKIGKLVGNEVRFYDH